MNSKCMLDQIYLVFANTAENFMHQIVRNYMQKWAHVVNKFGAQVSSELISLDFSMIFWGGLVHFAQNRKNGARK